MIRYTEIALLAVGLALAVAGIALVAYGMTLWIVGDPGPFHLNP